MDELRNEIALLDESNSLKMEEIKALLAKDKEGTYYKEIYPEFSTISKQDPPGNNCLLLAIAFGKYKLAELLIDDASTKLSDKEFNHFVSYRYKDPTNNTNCTNCYINTPLTLATKHEQYDLVQKLLNNGANPNGGDQYGFTTLTILMMQLGLVSSGKNQKILETIKLLQDKGLVLDQVNKFGHNALEYLEHDLDATKINRLKFPNGPHNIQKRMFTEFEIPQMIEENKLDINDLGRPTIILGSGAISADEAIYDSLRWGQGESSEKIKNYPSGRRIIEFDYNKERYLSSEESPKTQNKDYKQKFFQTEEGQNIQEELSLIIKSHRSNTLNNWFKKSIQHYNRNKKAPQLKIDSSLWEGLLDLNDYKLQLTEDLINTIGYHVIDNMFYQQDNKISKRNLTQEEIIERVQEKIIQDPKVHPIIKAQIIAKHDGISSRKALEKLERESNIEEIKQEIKKHFTDQKKSLVKKAIEEDLTKIITPDIKEKLKKYGVDNIPDQKITYSHLDRVRKQVLIISLIIIFYGFMR